jgi:uncharacterized protein with FMN-binding domain
MRRALLAVVTTLAGLVMLLNFKSHPSPAATATAPGGTTAGGAPSSGPSGSTNASGSSTTVTGDAADTRFGPVQVKVTVKGHTITDVTVVEYPQSTPRDYQINSYAIPVLTQATMAAQSAAVDMVSGATYTSYGYQQSLQSALDKAGW